MVGVLLNEMRVSARQWKDTMVDEIKTPSASNTVFVLIDEPGDVEKFGGPKQIDADKLGEQLKSFTDGIGRALQQCRRLAGEFELSEITLEAKLTAEFGFVLVSKAGVEGAVTLKFSRAPQTPAKSG
jgi:hypothetical protein